MAQPPPKKKALPPIPPPKPKKPTVASSSGGDAAPVAAQPAPTPVPAQPAAQPVAQNPPQTLSTSGVGNPTRAISPRAQPSRGQQGQGQAPRAPGQTPPVPNKPAKSRTPGWMKRPDDSGSHGTPSPQVELSEDFWNSLPDEIGEAQQSPIPSPKAPEPEPEPEPEPVNSDESISEGGTGFSDKIHEFRKVNSEVDAFHGSDKDERSEWTKLAEKAQSTKGPVANKVIKEHKRLIRISGKGKQITMTEVELSATSLNLAEVFVLDTGPIVYQWDGATAGTFLKNKANWYLKMLRDERQGKFETIIMDWDDENPAFYELLGGKPDSFPETCETPGWVPVLYRVTISVKGNLHFKEVGSGVGNIHKELLKTKGVFLYDLGFEMILWEGKQAFKGLRDVVMQHGAEEFKVRFDRNPNCLVTRVKEGGLNPVFNAFIGQM